MELISKERGKSIILLVDDKPENLRVLSQILTHHGYDVRKSSDGQTAITACKKILPDLILLDIMMPNLDGYQVCKHLKANEETRNIPIIFISALEDVGNKIEAFKVGGVDYITKPFQVEEVVARVTNQLTIRHLHYKLAEKNAQLEKLNEELKKSNAELEQFAYTASHDLKSPLQAILGYAHGLNWKYEQQLDIEGKRYIEQIIHSAWRMKRLIDDLLEYSKVGTHYEEFELVDCLSVLEEALANLEEDISASHARITHSELPKVMGDRTQLMQLFQNLISNAIKFRRPEVTPEIFISANQKDKSEWLFAVRDNGIGMESHDFDRIFQIFQRLHSYKEYPGTGIGMTICKKIVERHGGRIWLESQVGVGTIFYFTIH
ncbi:MAG TPA: response regulator [Leptolyngbyaceae cyanobacterium]